MICMRRSCKKTANKENETVRKITKLLNYGIEHVRYAITYMTREERALQRGEKVLKDTKKHNITEIMLCGTVPVRFQLIVAQRICKCNMFRKYF